MTQDAALTALCALTATLSGVAVVRVGRRDEPRPSTPHLSVAMVADRAIGWSTITGTASTQRRQLRVQIDAYGYDACTAHLRLLSLLASTDPRVPASGLAIQGIADASDITGIIGSGHEPRRTAEVIAAYDLTLTSAQSGPEATSIDLDVDDIPTISIGV
jgi:hypothetical protein